MKNKNFYALVIMLLSASTLQLSAQKRQYLHEGWTFGETHRQPLYRVERTESAMGR